MHIDGDSSVRDLLHPEWANIRLSLAGQWQFGPNIGSLAMMPDTAMVHGATRKAQWVEGGPGRAFCIALLPSAWPKLLKAAAERYADRLVPLTSFWDERESVELETALQSAPDFEARVAIANANLSARMTTAEIGWGDQGELRELNEALSDPDCATVEALADRVGISQSRLSRQCRLVYGFTPKLLLRRQRFLRMLHVMEQRPYSEWRDFIDGQYVDQSHMIRDFKAFLGLAPSRYFALERPLLRAAFDGIIRLLQTPPAG